MEIDAEAVISRLAQRIAQLEISLAVELTKVPPPPEEVLEDDDDE